MQWTRTPVDLLEQSVTAGGTAGPAERLYALLPEFLARRIAAHGQYQFEGVQLRFVQAPPNQRGAAELGITPRLSQWLPYSELLQAIGQHGTIEESWAREAAQSAAERFIRQVLYMVRSRPTLLLTNAQNIRSWWPSLTNSAVIGDHLGFAGSMSRAALYGPGLRHVRVRHAESFETPQWFAPNETTGRPGLAEGLWLPADADPGNRVFGSTTAKPATAIHAAVSASKLV